jgi:hypothetical protein
VKGHKPVGKEVGRDTIVLSLAGVRIRRRRYE